MWPARQSVRECRFRLLIRKQPCGIRLPVSSKWNFPQSQDSFFIPGDECFATCTVRYFHSYTSHPNLVLTTYLVHFQQGEARPTFKSGAETSDARHRADTPPLACATASEGFERLSLASQVQSLVPFLLRVLQNRWPSARRLTENELRFGNETQTSVMASRQSVPSIGRQRNRSRARMMDIRKIFRRIFACAPSAMSNCLIQIKHV